MYKRTCIDLHTPRPLFNLVIHSYTYLFCATSCCALCVQSQLVSTLWGHYDVITSKGDNRGVIVNENIVAFRGMTSDGNKEALKENSKSGPIKKNLET